MPMQAPFSSAYREALEIYGENSLVTYELFSDEQRGDLLQAIDEAYHTLTDESKRAAYNQMLVHSGLADPSIFARKTEKPPSAPPTRPAPVKHRDLQAWVKQKSKEEEIKQLTAEILGKDIVAGSDLKRLARSPGHRNRRNLRNHPHLGLHPQDDRSQPGERPAGRGVPQILPQGPIANPPDRSPTHDGWLSQVRCLGQTPGQKMKTDLR